MLTVQTSIGLWSQCRELMVIISLLPLCSIDRFDGNEHFVRNKPHGNAKSKDPFIPTKKALLRNLLLQLNLKVQRGQFMRLR